MKRAGIFSAIKETLRKYGVKKGYVFGSFARNERGYKDIDVAIAAPPKNFSLMDMAGVQVELEEETGKKVDVVMLRSLNPRIKQYIKKDLRAVL